MGKVTFGRVEHLPQVVMFLGIAGEEGPGRGGGHVHVERLLAHRRRPVGRRAPVVVSGHDSDFAREEYMCMHFYYAVRGLKMG